MVQFLQLGIIGGKAFEFAATSHVKHEAIVVSPWKAQGLYNGLLPFGVTKGDEGLPVADPNTYTGLEMMFTLASSGKSDRDVARALNADGYRTAGNRGGRPFTKDSVRGILINRFYVGELPADADGWIDGRHEPFVSLERFEEVQEMRARNRKQPKTVKQSARTYSLTGLLRCRDCSSPMWISPEQKRSSPHLL